MELRSPYPLLLLLLCLFCGVVSQSTSPMIQVKIGLMLPKTDPKLKPKIGYGTSAGAITIAINRIREEQILTNVNWTIIWLWPECEESLAMGISIELMADYEIDALIGPPCSIAAVVAGIMGKYYDIPLISWAATDPSLDSRSRFPTFARTCPSAKSLGKALVDLLKHYDWPDYALIFVDDEFQRNSYYISEGFREEQLLKSDADGVELKEKLAMKIVGVSPTDEQMRDFLKRLPDKARIVIAIFDLIRDRRRFLLMIEEMGMDTNEYVYVFPSNLPINNQTRMWVDYGTPKDGKDDQAKRAFEKSLARVVPKIMADWPYYYTSDLPDEQYGSAYSPYMHDAMYLYGRALNKTLEAKLTKDNGSTIIQEAKKIEFDGMTGKVTLDQFGSRVTDFVIKGIDSRGELAALMTIDMRRAFGDRVQQKSGNIWATRGGTKRSGRPVCGFDGKLCIVKTQDSNGLSMGLVLALVAGSCVLLLILFIASLYIRSKVSSSAMAVLLWKINRDELVKYTKNKSLNSVGSSVSSLNSMMGFNTPRGTSYELYYYRGTGVLVKKYDNALNVQMSGDDQRELFKMREFSAENQNNFIGLVLDGGIPLAVWQFAGKGNLQGISFIHSSFLGSHGRLTSAVCLIDNRWVLKISDYGLTRLRTNEKTSPRDFLWTAPEILREEVVHPRGSQTADIYSFGVIVWEILKRRRAYLGEEMTTEEIVYRVRKGESPPCRPPLEVGPKDEDLNPAVIRMTKDCWEETPTMRPDLKAIHSQLKGMMKGKTTNLMDHILNMMEKYATSLEREVSDRTKELHEEKRKSDLLLYRLLPRAVADKLKSGIRIDPETYESVTVFFSDVVSFTVIANRSTPMQVVNLLNELYSVFDAVIDAHDVYKVETIGDAYMCVSGVPHRNGTAHVGELVMMSMGFQKALQSFHIPHLVGEKLKLRIGLHTAGCIHVSQAAHDALMTLGGYVIRPRGEIMIKNMGTMTTYWVVGKGHVDHFLAEGTDEVVTK